MCTNLKQINVTGKRKKDTYNGKAGEQYDYEIFAKCGHCEQCRNEKANNWVIRNYYESKGHEKMCFLTLTYKENTYIFNKEDIQKFIKRLRRHLEYHKKAEKIRYFLVGELGTRTRRPHFHIIIYGWEDEKAQPIGYNKKGNMIYYSETIHKLWGLGLTTYQPFEKHEIPYISLYETIRDKESYEYRTSRESLKKLLKKLKEKNQEKTIRRGIIKNIENTIKKMEKEKADYMVIKEFNLWSQAIGYKEFEKQLKEPYIYTEYIEDKEFPTPSPWVKKLANQGKNSAIAEMLARGELTSNLTLEQAEKKAKDKEFNKKRMTKKKETEL